MRFGTAAVPNRPSADVASPRKVLDSSFISAIKGSTAWRLPLEPSARIAAERTPVLESLSAFKIVSINRLTVSSSCGGAADSESRWLLAIVPLTPPSAVIAASRVAGEDDLASSSSRWTAGPPIRPKAMAACSRTK